MSIPPPSQDMPQSPVNPFHLPGVRAPLRWLLQPVARLRLLAHWYEQWLTSGQSGAAAFLQYALNVLQVDVRLRGGEHLAALPRQGPVLITANHPLGGLEGILLAQLLLRHRPDLKVLTNELLLQMPEFADLFIGVDVLGSGKQAANARGLRQASRHLAEGGALLIFPAGTVAGLTWSDWRIRDTQWNQLVGRLAVKYQATCLPVYIEGRNKWSFYLTGLISKRLRTALLPRAMIAQRRRRVTAHSGPAWCLPGQVSAGVATDFLRLACELQAPSQQSASLLPVDEGTLCAPVPISDLREQLRALDDHCLYRKQELAVYCAPLSELGCLAKHLARERERTFREVGEGTGKAADEDRYDHSHQHIVVWDHAAERLVGGYRIAVADTVVAKHGLAGLYSYSLFNYDRTIIQQLGTAVEVGRSFVTADYQANPHALDFLWRGIGRFMLRHPQCHALFGCVSISRSYPPLLRSYLIDVLLALAPLAEQLRRGIRPRSPVSRREVFWDTQGLAEWGDIATVNKLLAAIAPSLRVPVIIRHYLSLGGRLADFTINRGFNNALDGLIAVDLRQTPDRYLKRYMGEDGMIGFHQRHDRVSPAEYGSSVENQ